MPREFAEWVRPIAGVLDRDRRELIAFASEAPPEFWDGASVVEGWSNKQILAHLAGGNDQLVQILLRATVAGEVPDPAVFAMDTDAENARRIAERAEWSIERLIGELERDGDEVQDLLARLTDADRERRYEGFSIMLGEFLRIVQHERHDQLHLRQLRGGRA